jgi:diguanylate cyclase (GGDEF)-like protein
MTTPDTARAASGTTPAAGEAPEGLASAATAESERRRARARQAVERGHLQVALFWLWTGASTVAAHLLGIGAVEPWPTATLLVAFAELFVTLSFLYILRKLREGRYRPRLAVTVVTSVGSLLLVTFCVLDGFTILSATLLITGSVLNLAAFAEANGFWATFLRSLLQTVIYGSAFVLAPKNPLSLEPAPFGLVLVALPVLGLILGTIAARHQDVRSRIVDLLRVRQGQAEELAAVNTKLRELSMVDGLTGVANRRRFDEELARELGRLQRTQVAIGVEGVSSRQPVLSLILIDVDAFKAYNDHLGHLAGDECLRAIAGALRSAVRRPGDFLARYGGEEFAILLPETDIEGAESVGERILDAVAQLAMPHPASPAAAYVTVSCGIAESSEDCEGAAQALIACADEALYRAKANGRARLETSAAAASAPPPAVSPRSTV